MCRKKSFIFACGGHGTRMGASIPKQFLRIGGKTILQITIERAVEAVPDAQIILVLPEDGIDFWKKECREQGFLQKQSLVIGGITRFHSVRNALSRVGDDDIVAVHDAVRPLAGVDLIRRAFERAETCPAVVPVVPVVDTLKVLSRGSDGTLEAIQGQKADRNVLFGAQTPQVFWGSTLKNAYTLPYSTSFTDDASVVEASGTPITYIDGERYNIKITTPEDLFLAGRLLP